MPDDPAYAMAVTTADYAQGWIEGTVTNHSLTAWERETEGLGELRAGLRLVQPESQHSLEEGRASLPTRVEAGATVPFIFRFNPRAIGSASVEAVLGLLIEGVRWLPQTHGTPPRIPLVFVRPVPPPSTPRNQTARPSPILIAAAPPTRPGARPWPVRRCWTRWCRPPFRIAPSDQVATAGSCFAQNIVPHLRRSGANFLLTEPDPGDGGPGFSARYGNIYTALQLRQLLLRAFGLHQPLDRAWRRRDGRFVDPFRPQLFPEGFATAAAVEAERARHLAAVREVFERCDVFLFTLGLTETWFNSADGTALPIPPGAVALHAGFNTYAFRNDGVAEVVAELRAFLEDLRSINPRVRLVLTVSPVPLVATFEDRHVLVSNTFSKAVLRVAAETLAREVPGVAYFPAFEMVATHAAGPGCFEADMRSVTPAAVARVMAAFSRHYLSGADEAAPAAALQPRATPVAVPLMAAEERTAVAGVICDEVLLDAGAPA